MRREKGGTVDVDREGAAYAGLGREGDAGEGQEGNGKEGEG